MAEGLARRTGTFWILLKQRQGQEGKASHGVMHLLLQHGEMGKSFVLSFSVSSPVLLQLFPSSLCVPFLNTHTQIKTVLVRGSMKDWRRISVSLLGSVAAEKSVNFLLLLHKGNAEQPPGGESSPRRLAAQLRCETWGCSPVGHLTLSGCLCRSAPTAKAGLTSCCLHRSQRWVRCLGGFIWFWWNKESWYLNV